MTIRNSMPLREDLEKYIKEKMHESVEEYRNNIEACFDKILLDEDSDKCGLNYSEAIIHCKIINRIFFMRKSEMEELGILISSLSNNSLNKLSKVFDVIGISEMIDRQAKDIK